MIIPVWVDKNKDAELIRWLGCKTNRSAFVRLVLYERMGEMNRGKSSSGNGDIDEDILKSIENL
jgi:DNA transposition AAA+ family ATPase